MKINVTPNSKTSVPNGSSKPIVARQLSQNQRYMLILKCSMVVCVVLVAGGIGYTAYRVVRNSEQNQFTQNYSQLVKQLMPATNTGIMKTMGAVKNIVNVISNLHPNASSWPNTVYGGFPEMAQITGALAGTNALGFLPIVRPSQVASFETFAYDYYAQYPDLYPADVATHSYGRGIFSVSPFVNSSDFAYHDTTGAVPWPTVNDFLTPALQLAGPGYSQPEQNILLMFNVRTIEEAMVTSQDATIECVSRRTFANETCSYVTGLQGTNAIFLDNPHSFIVQPIVADGSVVAYVIGTIFFNDILHEHIPVDTNGIRYVIESGDLVLTYAITHGVPKLVGVGDLHDSKFNAYRKTVQIIQGFVNSASPHFTSSTYSISFYPTKQYVASFESPLRWIFCFGSITLIMFVTFLFVAYDYFMVRENTEQQAVLDTKRQFVRFISHEVRTPLNAVAMAGDLMREQLLDAIKRVRLSEFQTSTRSVPSTPRTPRSGKGDFLEPTLEDSLDLCEEIIGNTKNAVEVLDDLLNYDKIEVGGLSLDLTFVAMEHVLDNVLKPFKGPAKQKDVSVVVNTDQYLRSAVFQSGSLFGGKFTVLRVVGDKIRLEQVIRNLISNALKFTSPMGKVVVTLEWVEDGLNHTVITSDLKHFLQVPSAASSTRRAEYTNKSRTMSSLTPLDLEAGHATAESSHYDHEDDDAFPLVQTQVPTSGSTKEMEEFNRLTIIKSAMTRKPKDAHNSRHWGSLRLSVTDDGAGMSPEQLRAVCSEGVQFNANELQAGQGSGLGLFIAKGIVKQHGGLMTVKSEGLHKGSTFVVELPVYACDVFSPWENRVLLQAKRDPVEYELHGVYGRGASRPSSAYGSFSEDVDFNMSTKSDAPVLDSPPHVREHVALPILRSTPSAASLDCTVSTEVKRVRRVLVVDDVASNRKMVIRLLQRSGVEVCEQAGDGQEAVNTFIAARQSTFDESMQQYLASLETQRLVGLVSPYVPKPMLEAMQPFDAVLMDFEMPVMNGPMATKKLRELGCTVPIVGISGNVLPADVQLFVEHGANAVLPKPLNFVELERIWSDK